jgi:polysaccharide biosynthesis protein PelD
VDKVPVSRKRISPAAWSITIAVRDLLRRLFPHDQTALSSFWTWTWAVFEALVFCTGAVAFNLWAAPQDPFGLHSQFPWLWIVPALLAMRYGTAVGVTSVLILVLNWLFWSRMGRVNQGGELDFPQVYFLGGLILILICGQFSDVWNARSRRLRAVNAYLDERLNTLTKNHFLLRLSHERLEQDLLTKPLTLRETLNRLRVLSVHQARDPANPLPGAREFIQLLGQSCQLEIAAVYALDAEGHPAGPALGTIGMPAPLAQDDLLFQYCMTQNQLSHVQTDDASHDVRDASRYLICAPLLPSSGNAVGVLVVEKLPFFALNDDTLQLLSVLIGYYADGIQLGNTILPVLESVPGCPPELALDIVRLHRIRLTAGIDSSLVALVFDNAGTAQDMFEQVKRLKRGVDLSWEIIGKRHSVLITLLPLASSAAVEGYLLRIEAAMQVQFGQGFLESNVITHATQLGFAAPADTLRHLVERCAA